MKENETEVNMLLAGDIGGTKTLLGLFEPDGSERPRKIASREFATLDYADLPTMLRAFLADCPSGASIAAAAFGVAGPVLERSATLTNVPWRVDTDRIISAFRFRTVNLLNDLEAMARGVTLLEDHELHTLQAGDGAAKGNVAVIAAGTGLGEAYLHDVAGRLVPGASEGGHADFAARTEREIELLRDLTARVGRADVEHVVSGMGLVNIHRVTHREHACDAGVDEADAGAPAKISEAALSNRCRGCAEALDLFVEAYGAEAGNHALRMLATGGVFIGGGIAPKVLPALTDGRFMRAFLDKAPFVDLLLRIPVHVVMNPEVGLIGAAKSAQIASA